MTCVSANGMTRARLEGDDVDMHVVAQIVGIDEARRRPAARGAGHRQRHDVLLVAEERLGHLDALDALVELADPVEARGALRRRCAASSRSPAAGRHSRPAAGDALSPAIVTVSSPSMTNSTPSAPASGSGRSLPPPGATSMMYCEKVSEKPDSGRDRIQARVLSQNGRQAGDDVAHHAAAG